jgi:hypothetical protein
MFSMRPRAKYLPADRKDDRLEHQQRTREEMPCDFY